MPDITCRACDTPFGPEDGADDELDREVGPICNYCASLMLSPLVEEIDEAEKEALRRAHHVARAELHKSFAEDLAAWHNLWSLLARVGFEIEHGNAPSLLRLVAEACDAECELLNACEAFGALPAVVDRAADWEQSPNFWRLSRLKGKRATCKD